MGPPHAVASDGGVDHVPRVGLAGGTSSPVLVSVLEHEAVPLTTLRERYGALLGLVNALLGVVPNCDSYLEIWPPAFRTYNVSSIASSATTRRDPTVTKCPLS